MLTSIIIPLYNAEKYIPNLIENLKKVDSDDIEFIFVNDGSIDRTKELCETAKIKIQNLTVINKPNGGVSSARNIGLDVANGEFICFADCDDAPKPNMYSILSNATMQTDCDMVMGGYEKVDSTGKTSVVELPYHGIVPGGAKEIAYSMAFWSGFVDGKPIHTLYGSVWPNLYKKSIIDTYNIRFPQGIVLGEDLLFNLDYLSHCKDVYMVNQSLYQYSVGNESATRKRMPNLWERYLLLLQQCEKRLTTSYGMSGELKSNMARQYLNDAISVIEEQTIPHNREHASKEIKSICDDLNGKHVPQILIESGTLKEKIEALLFKYRMSGLIYRWLK